MMTAASPRERVLARRRVIVRVGLGMLLATSVTACIFEKSNYQGGGRTDRGASAGTVSASGSTSASDTTTAPTDTTGFDAAPGG